MHLASAIVFTFVLFLVNHARCTKIQDGEYSGPQRHFVERSSNNLRKLVDDTNRHVTLQRQKRERWDFSNVTGNISNITLSGTVVDGVDISKSRNITCTDANGKTTTNLSFANISGNLENLKCFVDKNGKPVSFSFRGTSGNVHNIQIIGGDGQPATKPNSSFTVKPSFIFVLSVLMYFTMF